MPCVSGVPFESTFTPILDDETHLSSRIDDQPSWLSNTSKPSRCGFMRFSIFMNVLGTSITIFCPYPAQVAWSPLPIALAGGGVARSGSLLALKRNQENCVRYPGLNEVLKRENYLLIVER
jgi:hypothetical protein